MAGSEVAPVTCLSQKKSQAADVDVWLPAWGRGSQMRVVRVIGTGGWTAVRRERGEGRRAENPCYLLLQIQGQSPGLRRGWVVACSQPGTGPQFLRSKTEAGRTEIGGPKTVAGGRRGSAVAKAMADAVGDPGYRGRPDSGVGGPGYSGG